MKTGCLITVIGSRGSGKSPWVKNIARKSKFVNRYVNDVRREYTGEKYPEDKDQFITFFDPENFKLALYEVPGKEDSGIEKSLVIFEEATIEKGSLVDKDFRRFVTGAEHRNLFVFLLYHSVKDTPEFLIRSSNFIMLFETSENPDGWRDDRALLRQFAAMKKPVLIPCPIKMQ